MAKCCGQETYGDNERPKYDRRIQLIDQIKEFLGDMEEEERSRGRQRGRNGGKGCGGAGMRDMEEECRRYRKRRECTPPIITTVGVKEIRPTSEFDRMKFENSSQVTYIDATKPTNNWNPVPPAPWEIPRSPSQELRSGTLYQNCDCLKRNGLQHDCPRWDCGGRPECIAANPGPCCVPSKARKPIRGDRRNVRAEDSGKPQPSRLQEFPTGGAAAAGPGAACQCECECKTQGRSPQQPQGRSPQQPQGCPPQQPQVTDREFLGFVAMSPPTPVRNQRALHTRPPPKPQEKDAEFIGFVAVGPQGPDQKGMGIVQIIPAEPKRHPLQSRHQPLRILEGVGPSSGGDMVCLCEPADGGAKQQSAGGRGNQDYIEFVAVAPAGPQRVARAPDVRNQVLTLPPAGFAGVAGFPAPTPPGARYICCPAT